MKLEQIINEYESGDLLKKPDPELEAARLEIEQAARKAVLSHHRQTLQRIASTVSRTLITRYGCDD